MAPAVEGDRLDVARRIEPAGPEGAVEQIADARAPCPRTSCRQRVAARRRLVARDMPSVPGTGTSTGWSSIGSAGISGKLVVADRHRVVESPRPPERRCGASNPSIFELVEGLDQLRSSTLA